MLQRPAESTAAPCKKARSRRPRANSRFSGASSQTRATHRPGNGSAPPGSTGAAFRKLDATGGTSASLTVTASGTPSSLVGNAYIVYLPVS